MSDIGPWKSQSHCKKKTPRKDRVYSFWFFSFLCCNSHATCSGLGFFKSVFCILLHIGQLVLLETSLNCGHTFIPLSSYLKEPSVGSKLETWCVDTV